MDELKMRTPDRAEENYRKLAERWLIVERYDRDLTEVA